MSLKDNRVFKGAMVLVAVAMLTGTIGAVLSAQMGSHRAPGGQTGQGGPGMMGPGMMRGPGGGPGGLRGPGGPVGMLGPMMRELGLTDAQHEQIRGVMESHNDESKVLGDRMMTAREALNELVTAGTLDEAAIRAKAAEVAAVDADMAVFHAKMHAEVFALLTPDQQQKAKALRSEMQQRMKEGRTRIREQRGKRVEQKRGRPEAV